MARGPERTHLRLLFHLQATDAKEGKQEAALVVGVNTQM